MSSQSSTISSETAKALRTFCGLCQYIHEQWITSSALFGDMANLIEEKTDLSTIDFQETSYGSCLFRLNQLLNDYCIMEISKLHDRATDRKGNKNLSIDYIAKQDFWSEEEQEKINSLVSSMEYFFKKIKPSRDKILAHNDLSTCIDNKILGGFSEGDDERYFQDLSELCTLVWDKVPYENSYDSERIFDFSKSGIEFDPFCPATQARALRDLIVDGLKNLTL